MDDTLSKTHKKLYYCEQCGFPCDEKKTFRGKVYGDSGDTIKYTVVSNDDITITVKKGCPFCGSPLSKK